MPTDYRDNGKARNKRFLAAELAQETTQTRQERDDAAARRANGRDLLSKAATAGLYAKEHPAF